MFVKGTTKGTVTDLDGKYRLSVDASATTLVFSYIGFVQKEVAIAGRSTIDLALDPDSELLQEVIVTGYQTTAKEKSSIAVQSVSAETIQNRPNANFAQTLQGQIAGLNITTSNGQPGGNTTINLRGVGSINGNTEPLFIIDGTPVDEDNFRSLNPNDIANVTVLKDAGATAIYGNRGANGVVVITTKSGTYGSGLKVNYTGQVNLTYLQPQRYDLMSSPEQLRLEQRRGVGRGSTLTDAQIDATPTFDWFDFFFDAGVSNIQNLTISNGKENVKTFTSIGFTNQDGVLKSSSLQRYNMRNNISGKTSDGKLNYAVNTSINYSKNNEPNNIGGSGINRNLVLGAFQSAPYITSDDYVDGASLLSPLNFVNTPLFLMDLLETFTRRENEMKLIGSANVNYEIVKGLVADVKVGADFTDIQLLAAEGPTSFNALLFAPGGRANNLTPGFADQFSTRSFTYNAISSLSYQKKVGDHSFGISVFSETYRAFYDRFGFRTNGLDPKTFSPGDGAGFVADNAQNDWFVDVASATKREAGLQSFFGTADYDYQSRFGANVTVRRDASYRFAGSNRWGTFYAVSGRWNIHNEEFLKGSMFDVLKLRASYGKTGNQQIVNAEGIFAPFAAADLTQDFYATGRGYLGQNSIFLSQIGNTTLRWEEIAQTNVGVDIEILDSRLRGSFDFYVKRTNDVFQDRPVSAINGTTNLRANTGNLENRGLDWLLEYDVFRKKNGLTLTLRTVGNYNKQEVLNLPTPDGQVINNALFGLREGGKISEYYVYRYAGVNPDNGNAWFLTADGEITESPNVNNDRVWLNQNIYPDVFGSFGFDLDYKGFFVSTLWTYTIGANRFDFDYSSFMNPGSIGQFRHSRDILQAWTPDNRNTDVPSLTAANFGLVGNSDRFLTSNDYVRLRFVTVGYTVPKRLLEPVKYINNAKVFVNAENLVTFTGWRGFDAESLSPTGSRLYPSPRIVSFGVELGL